mgnify:CR=1 FL=1
MQLLAVELSDFRNVANALVEPHPRFNVLAGDNGQGKTNFLEAVYLVGTLRSFRAGRLDELVRFGAKSPGGPARASARVERNGLSRRYDVEVWASPARKRALVDGKPVRAAAEYFGGFNVVLFAPDDLRLPRGQPAARRRFLDRAVWNVEPALLAEAQTYERALKARNTLLRTGEAQRDPALLESFDEPLARAGASLAVRRRRYVSAIAPRVQAAFEQIGRSGLAVEVRYESAIGGLASSPSESEPIAEELRALLRRARPRDLAAGFTTAGPHTDDLELLLDGRPAGRFASQGQLRALVLALKVAEIGHLAAVSGEPPVLLLDDVSSELDPSRNAFLFEFLRAATGQVFITTTDPRHVLLDRDRRDFHVRGGIVC